MKRFIAIGVLMLIIALCTAIIVWFIFQDAVATQVEEVILVPAEDAEPTGVGSTVDGE